MKTSLYFILADENLFHPHYLYSFLKSIDTKSYVIRGITISKNKFKKGFYTFLFKQILLWGLSGFFFIACYSLYRKIFSKVFPSKNYTIESIAKNVGIKVLKISDVNNPEHLRYLKSLDIDIIISSNGQIFKKELLNLPNRACINRHTGLLPKYGGVFPVFWAMLNKEREFGVSIHYMTTKIDEGDIISQEKILLLKRNSMFMNYIIAFDKSVTVTLNSLKNIKNRKVFSKFDSKNKTYFSIPSIYKIHQFKSGRNKAFNISDVQSYFRSKY